MEPAPNQPPQSRPPIETRQPWPMKWIVAIILIYVVGYTWVNIAYRKPRDTAHEPWAEMKEREHKGRLVNASMHGWTKLTATLTRSPADAYSRIIASGQATVRHTAVPDHLDQMLPDGLALIMRGKPDFYPHDIMLYVPTKLSASAEELFCFSLHPATAPASASAFGECLAYTKDKRLFLFVQDASDLPPVFQAIAANTNSTVTFTMPANSLETGAWTAMLYTTGQELMWSFTVE